MHFYCATRGVKDVVDRYINDLLAFYSPWNSKLPGKMDNVIQLGVRPLQLWEIVFPQHDMERALRIICPQHGWDRRAAHLATMMRKLTKSTKLPEKFSFPKGTIRGIPSSRYVSVIPIGLKPDVFKKGIEQL